MRIPFRLVDVFTNRPLAGNQLCVIPEPVDLDDDQKQAIAAEIGFSETTFVTSAEEHRYSMRIFTPAKELPFAGHPTLGTAFVLVSEGRSSRRRPSRFGPARWRSRWTSRLGSPGCASSLLGSVRS
jgi:trans-2,3-dihydro-3-hydroxyanthranilate isomerase